MCLSLETGNLLRGPLDLTDLIDDDVTGEYMLVKGQPGVVGIEHLGRGELRLILPREVSEGGASLILSLHGLCIGVRHNVVGE